MLKAAKAYLVTQVSTASQGDLLLMLYDTAIKHLRQAIEKMQQRGVAAKGILISKAITIISELQACLNKERGGDIAKNLLQLYFFCNTRLLQANLKMKPEMVEDVINILSGLRQAFAQILPTQDGVASLAQHGAAYGTETPAPAIKAPAEVAAAAAGSAGVDEVAPALTPAFEEDSAGLADEPAAAPGPVNNARFRAAHAYATSR